MLRSDAPLASLASLASVAPVARPRAMPALPLAEVIGALSYAIAPVLGALAILARRGRAMRPAEAR